MYITALATSINGAAKFTHCHIASTHVVETVFQTFAFRVITEFALMVIDHDLIQTKHAAAACACIVTIHNRDGRDAEVVSFVAHLRGH